ncbi:MAG: hypothetical protein NUV80_00395 [Candidatus Berkelbacteria bacterium]|nr:hypothetical protein [Candidatus Berkelbacteria bacterium]MCR4307007.1 hypothetical protein [Candidatus Berkelbacteria bacterium]
MSLLAYVSGKIRTEQGQCFVGDQKIDCPNNSPFGLGGQETQSGTKLDILPNNFITDSRNDTLFTGIFSAIVVLFVLLAAFKAKIFGKTLGEYLKPIWYYVVICLLVVVWQYLFGLKAESGWFLRVSQWIWELAIALSVIQLVRKNNFNFGNVFFLAVLYALIIHGTKVSVRYFFYDKTLLYVLDRFIYGSLLVFIIVCAIGGAMILVVKNGKDKEPG